MQQKPEPVSGEVFDPSVTTPSALEVLQRTEIDVQISTAKRYPRSIEQFKVRATQMATLDAETAESCIYRRPVGKGEDGKQKIAEGMSIRMAEIVAASYGNIRSGSRVIEQTERYVKCQGVCHDLETNNSSSSEVIESTVDKHGRPFSERMRVVAAKACLAKAHRDAIFKVVPRALARPVELAARAVITGEAKPLEERRQLAQKWIGGLRLDEARVFAVLDVKGWADVGDSELVTLTGLRTAIKDGDTTVDEAFPPLTGESDPPAPGAGQFPKSNKSATPAAKEPDKGGPSEPTAKPQDSVPVQSQGREQEPAKQAPVAPAPAPTAPVDRDALLAACIDEWFVKRGDEAPRDRCADGLRMYLSFVRKTTPEAATSDVLADTLTKIKANKIKLASYDKER